MTEPAAGVTEYKSPTSRSDGIIAVLAGFLGWTFDAFDYFLVTLVAPNIAATYGISEDKVKWTLWGTLFSRPVGALIFGLLADRYGRRRPLMLNLVFYSTLSVLSGLSPTFGIFFACRILFGIGMGGEWGVGASLALEKVPVKLRGLMSGILQEGYAFGSLLSSAAFLFLLPLFDRWMSHGAKIPPGGWRLLFLLGGLPALLSLVIRSRVRESEVWEKTRSGNWSSIGSTLLSHWKVFLMLVAVMFGMNLSSHGTQDNFPKLLTAHYKLGAYGKGGINAVGAIGAIIGGIVVGMISGRLGRRRSMVISLLGAVAMVPVWAFAPTMAVLIAATFLIQFFVQGAWGVVPAYITEMSPDSVRGVLPGFAYQCGAALSGGIVVAQEAMEGRMSLAQSMALTAVEVFVFAAIVIECSRERRNIVFGEAQAAG
jgi:SHS family lactate transporter-like MFS transporter